MIVQSGATLQPPEQTLRYVGVGSNAAGVRFVSTATQLFMLDSVVMTAEAFDGQGAAIPGTPIRWTTSDATRARIPDPAVGRIVALAARGGVTITAALLTSPAPVTQALAVLPRPTALLVQAGNTQQGPVGAALAQPTNTLVAQSLASPVTVAARDAGGNPVTGFTGNVTLAVGANPGGATLGGTVTVAAVAGIATFANLTLSAPGTGYTLAASSGALTGATSSSFNITSAAAPSLQFGVHPLTSTVAGTPLAPALTVTARDAGGSIVTAFTGTGTFATVNATPPLSALPSYSGGAVTIGGGTGTLRIASGATLTLESGGTGAGLAVLNQGTLVLRASNDINGPLTNSAGATLRVQ